MRARFIRSQGRVATRGRYIVPLSAAAAVALAAGTVAAVHPLTDGSDIALTQSGVDFGSGAGTFTAGQAVSLTLAQFAQQAGIDVSWAFDASGALLPGVQVTGLPEGLQFDATTGMITGTPTTSGSFSITVSLGTNTATVPVVVAPEGSNGSSTGADGTITTDSLGGNNPLTGAVTAVLGSLGITSPETPGGETTTGSLGNGTTGSTGETTPTETTTGGELGGTGTGQVNVQTPGSSVPGGSMTQAVPVLALSGALLLGLAAAGTLGAGSAVPGLDLQAGSNGSTGKPNNRTTGGSTSGSTGSNGNGSTGGNETATAKKPETARAPGPEVNNGRG